MHGKKVIHRDLKPSNIFMTADLDISIGTCCQSHVRMIDFILALKVTLAWPR